MAPVRALVSISLSLDITPRLHSLVGAVACLRAVNGHPPSPRSNGYSYKKACYFVTQPAISVAAYSENMGMFELDASPCSIADGAKSETEFHRQFWALVCPRVHVPYVPPESFRALLLELLDNVDLQCLPRPGEEYLGDIRLMVTPEGVPNVTFLCREPLPGELAVASVAPGAFNAVGFLEAVLGHEACWSMSAVDAVGLHVENCQVLCPYTLAMAADIVKDWHNPLRFVREVLKTVDVVDMSQVPGPWRYRTGVCMWLGMVVRSDRLT